MARLADLDRHEVTSPAGESRVAALLRAARALSWPLIVDGDSGLILDGSHRAVVLSREFGARFVVVTGNVSARFERNSTMPVMMANCGW